MSNNLSLEEISVNHLTERLRNGKWKYISEEKSWLQYSDISHEWINRDNSIIKNMINTELDVNYILNRLEHNLTDHNSKQKQKKKWKQKRNENTKRERKHCEPKPKNGLCVFYEGIKLDLSFDKTKNKEQLDISLSNLLNKLKIY